MKSYFTIILSLHFWVKEKKFIVALRRKKGTYLVKRSQLGIRVPIHYYGNYYLSPRLGRKTPHFALQTTVGHENDTGKYGN